MVLVVTGLLAAGLLSFTGMATGLVSRNLATNHAHQNAHLAGQAMLGKLSLAASTFRLFDASTAAFSDVTATPSGNLDPHSGEFRSNQASGVRFWQLGGGPYKITASAAATSTSLTLDFGVNGALPYVPEAGDKVELPLVNLQFDVDAVTTVPTMASKTGVVTLSAPLGVTITVSGTSITTANFYRRAAYSVQGSELRYHRHFTGTNRANAVVVARGVTSPTPFSLLFESGSSALTDALEVHVSLELADLERSARRYQSTTTTLQSFFSPRHQPTPITAND